MEEKKVFVPNISCGHCVATIKRELGELAGVEMPQADAAGKTVTIRWRAPATWEKIQAMLTEIGFPPGP